MLYAQMVYYLLAVNTCVCKPSHFLHTMCEILVEKNPEIFKAKLMMNL
jgi:hypothetical protein